MRRDPFLLYRKEVFKKYQIDIVDEWAAVLKHQDEVSKEAEYKEKILQKEQQRSYCKELQKQRHDLEAKNKLIKEQQIKADLKMLKEQNGMLKQNFINQETKEMEKRSIAVKIMRENIEKKRRAEELEKDIRKNEEMEIINAIKQSDYESDLRECYRKNTKLASMNSLKQSYDLQEELKRKERIQERERDKIYLEKEIELRMKDERDRQRYFDVLKEKQRIANQRENFFKNYANVPLKDLEQRDELKHLDHIKESMKKEQEDREKEWMVEQRVISKYI